MAMLTYENRPVSDIEPHINNARMHSPGQIKQLMASMTECGFINPIVLDKHSRIVAGHARLEAAIKLGYSEVPCLLVEHLSEEQVRAYRLADNKIAENATWDENLLRVELEFLSKTDIDIISTGFSVAESDIIIGNADLSPEPEVVQEDLLTPAEDPVSQYGDIWLAGTHKIGCGDVRDKAFLSTLVCEERVEMVFTDPPYNEKAKNALQQFFSREDT
ncbi:MAG: ParB N-terminal domain-containing protein, partial [Alphaproteobacteria bacterium]